MKKFLLILLSVVLVFSLYAQATSDALAEKSLVKIGALKGPTSMGLVKLVEDSENQKTKNEYSFLMAATADELTPLFLRGELDAIAVPANLASVLYNKTNGQVKLAAINTLGVLYIVSKGEKVESFADLEGKTIYATGKSTMPEAVLNYLLDSNNVKNCDIQFRSEPSEIVTLLKSAESGIAMLPQPFVTVAQNQIPELDVSLDLTEEYNKVTGLDLITGVLVVRNDFVSSNEVAFKKFLKEYEESASYAVSNVKETAALVEKAGIVKAAIAEKALPYCNIVLITGQEMKNTAKQLFDVLYNYNPSYVGGSVPDDAFYY